MRHAAITLRSLSVAAALAALACGSDKEGAFFSPSGAGAAGTPNIGIDLEQPELAAGGNVARPDTDGPGAGIPQANDTPQGSPNQPPKSGCQAPNIAPVAYGTKTDGSRVAAYVFSPEQEQLASFVAFGDAAREGVRLAVRELDGGADYELVTAPGPGAEPIVRIFSARGKPDEKFALSPYANFRGGIRVAACDVNGDGRADIITAPGARGGSLLKAFDRFDTDETGAPKELASFVAFPESAEVEVFVACGDLDADGNAEIGVSLGPGAPALARLFDVGNGSGTLLTEFVPYTKPPIEVDPDDEVSEEEEEEEPYLDGTSIAVGDLTGDGRAEIVSGNLLGSPELRTFSYSSLGATLLKQLFPYGSLKDHGLMIAIGQTDETPELEIIVGPATNDELPRTHILDGAGNKKLADVFPYNASLDGGVEVAAVPRGAQCN